MQIEAGKFYRTRDGRKVGPCESSDLPRRYEFGGDWDLCHWADGTYCGDDRSLDIGAEWPDSPVQLVPRVIPGTYGKVRVTEGGYVHCKSMRTAEEIRDTIATLEQIAEAM